MEQERILNEKLKSAAESVEKGLNAYQGNDLLSSLEYLHKAMSIYKKINIAYPNRCDVKDLKEKIETIEQKLGLHVVQEDGKYGYADVDGNIVIPCKWRYALNFSEGLASVTEEYGLTGYINYHGELVIPCVYRCGYSFADGLAYVEVDSNEELLPEIGEYIDIEGSFIGFEMHLDYDQIRLLYETLTMFNLGQYEEAVNRLTPLAEECGVDITPIEQLIRFYEAMGQYDKVVEWCKEAEDDEAFAKFYAWPKLMLGEYYEKGLGVDMDLREAAHWYDMIQIVDDLDEYVIEERNDFYKRHPELLDIIDSQNKI